MGRLMTKHMVNKRRKEIPVFEVKMWKVCTLWEKSCFSIKFRELAFLKTIFWFIIYKMKTSGFMLFYFKLSANIQFNKLTCHLLYLTCFCAIPPLAGDVFQLNVQNCVLSEVMLRRLSTGGFGARTLFSLK